jgi:hypothetical protein
VLFAAGACYLFPSYDSCIFFVLGDFSQMIFVLVWDVLPDINASLSARAYG